MRELLPDPVRKVFIGSRDRPAPLKDAADAISVWSVCLVTGMTILWRAGRGKSLAPYPAPPSERSLGYLGKASSFSIASSNLA
jgi:hypothetical protein